MVRGRLVMPWVAESRGLARELLLARWGGSRRNSEEREQELSFRHLRLRCQSDFQLEKCGKQTGLQIRQKVWAEL